MDLSTELGAIIAGVFVLIVGKLIWDAIKKKNPCERHSDKIAELETQMTTQIALCSERTKNFTLRMAKGSKDFETIKRELAAAKSSIQRVELLLTQHGEGKQ